MNAKEAQKQRSREAILASAAALMRRQGIRASSVSDVMKGAGLTVGGFYGHFVSKDALFAETLRSAATGLWKRLLDSAQGNAQRFIGRYLSRAHRDHPEAGCVLPSTVNEIAAAGSEPRAAMADVVDELSRTLGPALGMPKLSRERALGLMATLYGALALSRATAGTPVSDELLAAGRAAAQDLT